MAKDKGNKKNLPTYVLGAVVLAGSAFMVFIAINVVSSLLG